MNILLKIGLLATNATGQGWGKTGFIIAWIICTGVVFFLYHSVFKVTYFSSQGCLSEIIVCGILGLILSVLVMFFIAKFWFIFVGIGILIAIVAIKNKS